MILADKIGTTLRYSKTVNANNCTEFDEDGDLEVEYFFNN